MGMASNGRRWRIAQVAPPFVRVPPPRYGGTERVVSVLTEELVRRGHDVTLFAPGDSETSARLVPTVERALWRGRGAQRDALPYWTVTLGKLERELDRFDVVHSHVDYFGFPLARLSPRPMVTTLHGRLDLPDLRPVFEEYDDVPLVSISNAQRRPALGASWIATVYHGVRVDRFTFRPERGQYLAFLGRIAPEKGVDTAIRVAQRAGMPIRIAARMPLPQRDNPEAQRDWDYYESEVQPLLEEPCVQVLGQVGGSEKDDLLGHAAALLFPIHWPEPFGLVMIEALATGTPVIALRQGSVPEVLSHGHTGFICESEDEMVAAVGRLDELDRARCRRDAEARFSAAAMADSYERVYQQLVDGRLSAEC